LVLAVKSGRVARVTTGELINLTVQKAADAERVLGILRRRAPQGVSE
jgi:hypothetical protein